MEQFGATGIREVSIKSKKEMVGTRRLELLTSTVSSILNNLQESEGLLSLCKFLIHSNGESPVRVGLRVGQCEWSILSTRQTGNWELRLKCVHSCVDLYVGSSHCTACAGAAQSWTSFDVQKFVLVIVALRSISDS